MHWRKPVLGSWLLITSYFIVHTSPLAAQTSKLSDSLNYSSLNEVVVTGLSGTETLKQSVFKIRTINQATIRARAANDIYALLTTELGVRLAADNALGETDMSIMGMGGNNVKVLLNGVPLLDRGSIRQSLGQVDINSIERIELVEGPLSVLYGSDALAGVVNIITRKAGSAKSALSVQAKVQEESMGKVYRPFAGDGIHQKNISVNWKSNRFAANAYLTAIEMGGWKGNAPLRSKEVRPKDQLLSGFSADYNTGKWKLAYRFDYANEEIYAPGQYNQNNTAVDAYYTTNRYTQQLTADWKASSRLDIHSAFSYQDYKRNTSTYRLDFVAGTKQPSRNEGEWDVVKFNSAFGRIVANWQWTNWLKLQPGIELKSEQGSGDRIEGSPRISDYAFFLSGELQPISTLQIRPGLRMNHNTQYDAPPVISSINIKYQLFPDWDLRASYGRGFRAPALRELYFQFFDANHAIQGNPALKAEYSNSYQATVSWQPDGKETVRNWRINLSGFYNDFKNRIALAQGTGNVFSYFNIDRFKTKGGGLDMQYATRRYTIQAGFLMIGRYNSFYGDSNYVASTTRSFAWSPEANLNATYSFPKWGLDAGFFYKYNGALPVFRTGTVAGQTKPSVYLAETAAYHWADLTLTKKLGSFLQLQAGIKNIFGVTRIDNTATDGGAAHAGAGPVLMAFGRSWFSALQFNWSKQNKKKDVSKIM